MAEQGGGAQDSILQFLPFVSRLDTGFWHELGHRKLEKYKLSEDQHQINGYYSNCEYILLSQSVLNYNASDLYSIRYLIMLHRPMDAFM